MDTRYQSYGHRPRESTQQLLMRPLCDDRQRVSAKSQMIESLLSWMPTFLCFIVIVNMYCKASMCRQRCTYSLLVFQFAYMNLENSATSTMCFSLLSIFFDCVYILVFHQIAYSLVVVQPTKILRWCPYHHMLEGEHVLCT
jgi:hypothetical protein